MSKKQNLSGAEDCQFNNYKRGVFKKRKPWPKDCIWPEPLWDGQGGHEWEEDLIDYFTVDEDARDMLDIKEYYDELVQEGRLNPDYSLNDDYELIFHERSSEEEDNICYEEDWQPEKGLDYWDDGFMVDCWQEDLTNHMNFLKIDYCDPDPVIMIRDMTGYDFINENLARQAFTRRAFQLEYGLKGSCEELEFLGDTVLNTIVTREIFDHLTRIMLDNTDGPFEVRSGDYKEGELSKLRTHFVNKEYLSERAGQLGMGKLILYGAGEQETDSSLEDAIEALIGAVALDCNWDWDVLEGVVDKLVCLQLSNPDKYLKKTYYDIFNAWHQKHFGLMPKYEVYDRFHKRGSGQEFECSIRFFVPDNDKNINTSQLIHDKGPSRSKAREYAAELAYRFVRNNGLWINLKDANIIPDQDNSINQLQELFQKKYVDKPVYEFEEEAGDRWYCRCLCNDVDGFGRAGSKTAAKKKAAYMVLVLLLSSAGCAKE